ncbi:hypothetical protein LSTR_LSTR004845 [Laodelphax striatellus]|uniref:Uncharacterized protein n=1 Tax=Laodelphax striatellus TaxID=195883 RepID=A0A482WHY4_LAOST|nr:hypothetical protein LSTR_LSTR004845 [Laodelphax striatellus]
MLRNLAVKVAETDFGEGKSDCFESNIEAPVSYTELKTVNSNLSCEQTPITMEFELDEIFQNSDNEKTETVPAPNMEVQNPPALIEISEIGQVQEFAASQIDTPANVCDSYTIELQGIPEMLSETGQVQESPASQIDTPVIPSVEQFSKIGERDVQQKTSCILLKVLTNGIATKFSFLGKNRKVTKEFAMRSFTNILSVIKTVTMQCKATEEVVSNYIKNWLKFSPKRLNKEKCDDLKVLMKFCEEPGSREYYEKLLASDDTAVGADDLHSTQ